MAVVEVRANDEDVLGVIGLQPDGDGLRRETAIGLMSKIERVRVRDIRLAMSK